MPDHTKGDWGTTQLAAVPRLCLLDGCHASCSNCSMPAVDSLGAQYLHASNVDDTNMDGSYLIWNGPAEELNFSNSDDSLTTLGTVANGSEALEIRSGATNVSAWNGLVCNAPQ